MALLAAQSAETVVLPDQVFNPGFASVLLPDGTVATVYEQAGVAAPGGTALILNLRGPGSDSALTTALVENTATNTFPDVTALEGGGFALTWLEQTPDLGARILTQVFSADGSATGGVIELATNVFGSSSAVAATDVMTITALEGGGHVVAWKALLPDFDTALRAKVVTAEGVAQPTVTFSSSDAPKTVPEVVGTANGGFAVVWATDRSTGGTPDWAVLARHYDAAGNVLGTPTRLLTLQTDHGPAQSEPPQFTVAALPDGGLALAVVTVVDNTPGGFPTSRVSVTLERFDADGTSRGSPQLADWPGFDRSVVGQPDMALLSGGRVLVAFPGFDEGQGGQIDGDIFATAFSASGTPLGTTPLLNSTRLGEQSRVTISVNGDDTVLVGWASQGQSFAGDTGANAFESTVVTRLFTPGEDLQTVLNAPVNGGRVEGTDASDVINGSPARDTLEGGAGNDTIRAEGGDDTVTGGPGDDVLEGGAGTDTARYSGDQDSYTLVIRPDGFVLEDRRAGGDGTDTLTGFEFLDFEGGSYFDGGDGDLTLFDLRQFADFATLTPEDFRTFVEIYIAYFDRAPDAVGLFFWGTVLAKGQLTLEQIADDFFTQPETQATYPDLTDNAAFAQQVYQNVLGRQFDQAGLDFWVGALDGGFVTKSQFILALLEGVDAPAQPGDSAETIAQRALDAQYLETKTDLGIYYAVILGMSDVQDARDAMALYDGTPASVTAARAEMDADFDAALDPVSGEFLMPLVGVVDDPFAA